MEKDEKPGKAPEGEDVKPTGEGGEGGEGGNPPEPEKKYTDADLDTIVQKRLARERGKLEKEIRAELAKKSEEELTEAEKLRNMTELERAQHEAKKLREEKEALEAERDLNAQMAIARKELSDAGIPMADELLCMFVSKEADKTAEAIDKLKQLWPETVNAAVKEQLKRDVPPAGGKPSEKSYGATFAQEYSKRMNGGK